MTIKTAFKSATPLYAAAELFTAAIIVFVPFWAVPVLNGIFKMLAGI